MQDGSVSGTPQIFSFKSYSSFLKARYEFLKREKRQFSFRYCARRLGTTHSYLKGVLDGKKRIGLSRISKFAALFELDAFEAQYFTILVIRDLVEDKGTVHYLTESLSRMRFELESLGAVQETRSRESDSIFVSNWLYAAIIELINFPDFVDDEEWILSRLIDGPSLQTKDVRNALDDMLKRGVIERINDRYRLKKAPIWIPDPMDGSSFKAYRGIVQKTWDVLGDAGKYARNHFFEAVAALNSEDEAKLFVAAERYRDEIMKIAQNSKAPDRLLVISSNLFNLAKRHK